MLRVLQICKASVVSTVVSVFAVAAVGTEPRAATSAPQKAPASTTKVTSFGRLPLTFEKNTGRYDKRVQFLTRTGGATVFVTANEMVMVLPAKAREKLRAESGEPRAATPRVPSPRLRGEGQGEGYRLLSALASQPSAVLRMKLVGANAKAGATGLEKQPGIVNYFIGNDPKKWRTRVPTYAKAKLAGVYPGIDLVYYGVSGERREVSGKAVATRHSPLATHLEYDFIIKPGADPRRIQLAFEGADRIRVADGDLILSTPAGDVRMKRPYAYQTIAGKRVQVACDYKLSGQRAALRLARYDATRPLVVDPVLEYSTFLGGSGPDLLEWRGGLDADSCGNAWVVGQTYSGDFPVSAGAFGSGLSGLCDVFMAKFRPDGSGLHHCTYLGGSGDEGQDSALDVDATGAAYVTGMTGSPDFPTAVGALSRTYHGSIDAFVVKVSPDGSALLYATYLGGTGGDFALAIAVSYDGSAAITGTTASSDFPTTDGALDRTLGHTGDAFVTRVDASGSHLVYSTYLGGSGLDGDHGRAIAVDACGSVYVTGLTTSTDFPASDGAFDRTYGGGGGDAYVTRLTPDGSAVVYSTFLGGGGGEGAASIDVDVMGCAYIAGTVTGQDFPTTPGAYSERNLGGSDAFVAKLSADGTSLVYCTFIGGKDSDAAVGVAVDSYGAAHVVGCTYSTDFPVTAGALGTGHGSGWDVFLAKLADDGTELRFATAIGGLGHDRGCAIAMGTPGTVFVAGHTSSEEFVATDGAYCRSHRGGAYDAFLLCLKWVPTSIFTIGRVGTITELTILRGYLSRTSDAGKLDGRTVEFRIDGTAVGSAVTGTTGASGRADLNWTISDGPPLRTITAQFAGDHAYLPSSATATLTAQAWGTKMVGFDRTARIGGKTELKARLLRSDNVPLYNKLIDFSVDGTFVIARPTDTPGYARYPYYTVPDGAGAGTRTILAEWQGNAGYMASSASTTLNVLRATPYIWVMPRSVPQGGVARLYAYFRRLADYQKQEGKTVTFRIDGTWVADVVTLSGAEAGIARYQYTTIEPPGAHTIRCEFAGDAWVDAGYGE